MAVLKFPIVVKCKKCGTQVTLEVLETLVSDPEGELLFNLAKQISKNTKCAWCKAREKRERENG